MSRHSDKKRAAEAEEPRDVRLGDLRDAMRAADRRFLAEEAAAGRLASGVQETLSPGSAVRRLILKLLLLLAVYGAFIEFSWFAYKTQDPGLAPHGFAVVELSDRLADWLESVIIAASPARSKT